MNSSNPQAAVASSREISGVLVGRAGQGSAAEAHSGGGARPEPGWVGSSANRTGRHPALASSVLASAAGLTLVGSLAVLGSAGPWLSAVTLLVAACLAVVAFAELRRAPEAPPAPEERSPAVSPDAAPLAAALARTRIQELTTEVQRLRASESELISAKRDAEAAALAKGEFLATMSHEVRTPLNGILPILELVLGSSIDGEVRHQVSAALDSAREMRRIVNDVLDYSKLDSGKMQLEVSSLRPIEIVESVCTMMRRSAEAKRLKLTCSIDRSVPPIARGDSLRLRQVLTNLLSNAIKFTGSGEIAVEVAQVGEDRAHRTIRVAVRDTGRGIAAEDSTKLFQPFSQADASTARAHGGTGLGLAICRRIIEAMGGKIGVESAVGRGSTFWFTVPLLRAPGEVVPAGVAEEFEAIVLTRDDLLADAWSKSLAEIGFSIARAATAYEVLSILRARAEQESSPDLIVVDLVSANKTAAAVVRPVMSEAEFGGVRVLLLGASVDGLPLDDGAGRVRLAPRELDRVTSQRAVRALLDGQSVAEDAPVIKLLDPPIGHFGGTRALLVDDIAINRYAGQRTLEKLGVEVTLASGGREAIELMKKGKFDIVLMDCQMPDVDGYAVSRVMRLHERLNRLGRTPILAITANAMPGDRELCLEAGMDDHLAKPIELAPLSKMLSRWVGAAAEPAAEAWASGKTMETAGTLAVAEFNRGSVENVGVRALA